MIKVNAWTSYSEKIGDEYYFVIEDGYKNHRVEITKGNKIASRNQESKLCRDASERCDLLNIILAKRARNGHSCSFFLK